MALTAIQREVCRLIAENRVASGESYVAGAAALNELLAAPRLSRDVDLFHDTDESLEASWTADRSLLEASGFEVQVLRERPFFVEGARFVFILGASAEPFLISWTICEKFAPLTPPARP